MGIASCIGGDCPLKMECYRFLEKSNTPYFIISPYNKEEKKCAYFWVDII